MSGRIVPVVHGNRHVEPTADWERDLAAELKGTLSRSELMVEYQRFASADGSIDRLMRRVCFRSLVKHCGCSVSIGMHVGLKHPETFEIGDGVHLGDHAYLQGRFDGRFVLGNGCWIGPQVYLDARDLIIGNHVGWGPGAKVLGSSHSRMPADLPIMQTDLVIAPVRVEDGADIGVGAIILPGMTIGHGAMVGAGAVVTKDIPALTTVAGSPARVIADRRAEEKRSA